MEERGEGGRKTIRGVKEEKKKPERESYDGEKVKEEK